MSGRRVLYIDTPFENEPGGDKNRSRFLWQVLRGIAQADLALVHRPAAAKPGRPPFSQFKPVLELAPKRGPWWQSDSILTFDSTQRAAFTSLLARGRYDLVVSRFHAPWELCRLAANHPTRPGVVMDLDMVSSRLVGLTWKQDPSFKNRWFYLENLKLGRLEQSILRQPWMVCFSNPVEMEDLRKFARPQPPAATLVEVPNVMPDPPASDAVPPEPAILFFGSMNSAANLDGFRFLMDDILPRIEADLQAHGVRIHVAGKNPPAWFAERIRSAGTDRVVLLGAVDSMERTLLASRFVLLPLRVASGTRTRILEAAACGRAVVTTSIGAEGIDVGDTASVHDTPTAIATAVRTLLADPAATGQLGSRLRDRCLGRYSQRRVAADFATALDRFAADRKGGSR